MDSLYFDEARLSDQYGLDDDTINTLKKIYIDSCVEWKETLEVLVDKLEDGYSESVYHEAELITHVIKGSSVAVGDETLAILASSACDSIRAFNHGAALANVTAVLIRVKNSLANI